MNKIPASMLMDAVVLTISPNIINTFSVNKSDGSSYAVDCYNITYVDGLANALQDAVSARLASSFGSTPLISPSSPKTGDIFVSGKIIFIYLGSRWQQIYPPLWS